MDRLEASLPYEAGKKFCRVVYPSDVPASSRNYVIRVQMYNDGNDKGALSGSSGIMFNVQDINTFQLVYVTYVYFAPLNLLFSPCLAHLVYEIADTFLSVVQVIFFVIVQRVF